ncbi:hypothetical protein HDV57DRAFT_508983 [Trichoderma longibrachiatum]
MCYSVEPAGFFLSEMPVSFPLFILFSNGQGETCIERCVGRKRRWICISTYGDVVTCIRTTVCALRLDCVLVFMIPEESWRLLRLRHPLIATACLSTSGLFRHGTTVILRFLFSFWSAISVSFSRPVSRYIPLFSWVLCNMLSA